MYLYSTISISLTMNSSSIFESELTLPSVFKDENKLSIRYIPPELTHRTDELKFLARYFKGIFDRLDDGKNLVIHGPVGSGKTSITKKFGMWASERDDTDNIKYIHINCRINRNTFTILLAIARDLNKHIPSRGYSSHELLEMIIDILESKNKSLILVLDEIDFVVKDEVSTLLYSLCRSSDNKRTTKHHISLILIARRLDFLKGLDKSTVSTLGAGTLNLDKYEVNQLKEIFADRINEVFKHGAVTEEAQVLTASIAGRTGDARKGLELLWFAGKYADQESSPLIYPDYIRIAKGNIHPAMIGNNLQGLGFQKLLIYHALARGLLFHKTAFITTGQLIDAYALSCEEFNQEARKHTQIWEYVKELNQLGFIETSLSGIGQRGRTTLLTIEDISAKNLEEAVRELLTR